MARGQASVTHLLRCKIKGLNEIPRKNVGDSLQLFSNFLSVAKRLQISGVYRLNPQTPYEGYALFHNGELQRAEYGTLRGPRALAEMVADRIA